MSISKLPEHLVPASPLLYMAEIKPYSRSPVQELLKGIDDYAGLDR